MLSIIIVIIIIIERSRNKIEKIMQLSIQNRKLPYCLSFCIEMLGQARREVSGFQSNYAEHLSLICSLLFFAR